MTWHVIEGEPGCAYACEHRCVAVVVDALRASATAAMLLDAGATEIHAVAEVGEALRLKDAMPDALLFGERDGLPPAGFDHGNSPRETAVAKGRPAIFTTTTGTRRLLDCRGAKAVLMGTTVNAYAAVAAASAHGCDVVAIPAGRSGDPDFDAQEDWAAAVSLAILADQPIGEGSLMVREWRQRLELDGIAKWFESAPHAHALVQLGLGEDVAFCARMNVTRAVPVATQWPDYGAVLSAGSPA